MTFWHSVVTFALIITFFSLAGFVAYLLYGPGITITVPEIFRPATSTPETSDTTVVSALDEESGVLFSCRGGKALKAEFAERSVLLSLSDGRTLRLPRLFTAEGGVEYANTDGSFAFRNVEHAVFVEESGMATYADCVAE